LPETRVCHCGEHAVLLVANAHEVNRAVASKRIDRRVECVSDDSVASPNTGSNQHLPHAVGNCLGHKNTSSARSPLAATVMKPQSDTELKSGVELRDAVLLLGVNGGRRTWSLDRYRLFTIEGVVPVEVLGASVTG
jgi:hypothetical protein